MLSFGASHLLGLVLPRPYQALSLYPRSGHLWQLASFHWVHGNWQHLALNLVPLVLLGVLIATQGTTQYWLATGMILLVAGAGTWLFSSATRVLGASGLVFGYWGYILARAGLSGEMAWAGLALITLLFYSGLLRSLARVSRGVSWSCHFWGLCGGVAAALLASS